MNGKKAKTLRRQATNHAEYKRLKRTNGAQALTNASQAPKFAKERAHKPLQTHKPTWPRGANQRAQSRPIIVLRPLRAMARAMLASNPQNEDGTRSLTEGQAFSLRLFCNQPKHRIDAMALRY